MKRIPVSLIVAAMVAALIAVGCSQPAPTPTQAPAQPKAAEPTKAAPAATSAPAKPAEPTKAAAPAQPTAAPAAKVNWPEKGKTITIIVPYAAGGPVDVSARILQPALEKEFGIPIQIVNRGGSVLLGITELVNSKPDGYTVLAANEPATSVSYLDPATKATYDRKGIYPIAMYDSHPNQLAVRADSPIKGIKDLVAAYKAKPESVTIASTGVTSAGTFTLRELEEMAGVKAKMVHMDGAAGAVTALLGGHADAASVNITATIGQMRSGELASLGLTDTQRSKFLPNVPTWEEQGYKIYSVSSEGMIATGATPKAIVDAWAATIKKVLQDPAVIKKFDDMAYDVRYMSPEEYSAEWAKVDASFGPRIKQVRAEQAAAEKK